MTTFCFERLLESPTDNGLGSIFVKTRWGGSLIMPTKKGLRICASQLSVSSCIGVGKGVSTTSKSLRSVADKLS